ncbi:MAG: type II toxin-antitoxin system RelE/ParE family toxin [Mesorhizobium sp.]
MIRSFADRDTERLFDDESVRRFRAIERVARRKLMLLDGAESLDDLRSPPGNRLEGLKGDRIGRFSIRINDQWRICFKWRNGGADEVEIVDYH